MSMMGPIIYVFAAIPFIVLLWVVISITIKLKGKWRPIFLVVVIAAGILIHFFLINAADRSRSIRSSARAYETGINKIVSGHIDRGLMEMSQPDDNSPVWQQVDDRFKMGNYDEVKAACYGQISSSDRYSLSTADGGPDSIGYIFRFTEVQEIVLNAFSDSSIFVGIDISLYEPPPGREDAPVDEYLETKVKEFYYLESVPMFEAMADSAVNDEWIENPKTKQYSHCGTEYFCVSKSGRSFAANVDITDAIDHDTDWYSTLELSDEVKWESFRQAVHEAVIEARDSGSKIDLNDYLAEIEERQVERNVNSLTGYRWLRCYFELR